MVICIILSSLALTAAAVCAVVTVRERKRSREWIAGQLEDSDNEWRRILDERSRSLTAEINCLGREFPEMTRRLDRAWAGQLKAQGQAWEDALRAVQGRIDNLEHGAVPDYEKAKAAAKAVDDFHDGLANILNYDPYEMARRNRDGGGDGA
ncbi:MAG: hypothetical protein E7466_01785 [Ruminococcaceae bacterium]|nr:hypothetical protein [Oscillospiraceae bacterium]